MGRLHAFLLLLILESGIILGQFSCVSAQNLPEFLPPLPEGQAPLTLEEIVPERLQSEQAASENSEEEGTELALNAEARRALELDKLFRQLKRTPDSTDAARINRQIQGMWAQSGSDTVDLLMQWAEAAIAKSDYAQALDFLDNVVTLKPNFSEGWMRRASIHIQRHDLTLAMLDLARVLTLEPRHYQAMSQLGLVMEMTERKNAAAEIYTQALELYPQFVRLQKRLDNLLDEVTEQSL